MIKKVEFKNKYGLKLKGVVHIPKKYSTVFIDLHGFPGNMERGPKRICNMMCKLGYLCFRFNFSGTDTSEGKFEDKLMSKEVDDIKYAIDFLHKNFKFKKLVLMGHSTGAIDAALYAYKDNRISKLILSGCVGDLSHSARYDFSDKQVRDFWTKGYIVYGKRKGLKNTWATGKRLKKSFYDEFFKLDLLGSLHKFKKPVLIIHGDKDTDVPMNENIPELYAAANRPKKLFIMKGADHKYIGKYMKMAVAEINKFIKS